MGVMVADSSTYCRDLESYLCQKNDGHLVRIVGPAFDVVNAWLADGIPFKVACAGIDRYFERYYRKTTRRRPVRIDFCDADVRDVFDEWRRATGLTAEQQRARHDAAAAPGANPTGTGAAGRRGSPSLPEHLERALLRLTNARATGAVGERFDPLLDDVSRALDAARAAQGGLRGDARRALLSSLDDHDRTLSRLAAAEVTPQLRETLRREAEEDLSAYRDQLAGDRYAQALERSLDRAIRARLGLPTLALA